MSRVEIAWTSMRPMPGHWNTRLDVDGAAEHEARLDADDRNDVDERVAEGVLVDDGALAQALGAGGADVVLAEHLEHVAARQPDEHRAGDRGKRHGRQDEMAGDVADAAVAEEVDHAADRQPGEAHAEPEDEEDAEPEGRRRDADEHGDGDQLVLPAVLADRGDDAEEDAEDARQDERRRRREEASDRDGR